MRGAATGAGGLGHDGGVGGVAVRVTVAVGISLLLVVIVVGVGGRVGAIGGLGPRLFGARLRVAFAVVAAVYVVVGLVL